MKDKIGSIEEGKLADLTFINLNKVHTTPADNIYSQIIYSAHSNDVIHVMVDGNWVVKDGTPIAYDEKEIIHDAWEQCTALIERL
jgi:5-methylthioadenosine/S-adenosylhomocysteine deaminase